MSFNVTAPTDDEIVEINTLYPSKGAKTYPAPSEGYVRGTVIANELNKLLTAVGREDKKVRPQTVYNYISKGYIQTEEAHYPHVAEDVAAEWIRIQYSRRVTSENTNK